MSKGPINDTDIGGNVLLGRIITEVAYLYAHNTLQTVFKQFTNRKTSPTRPSSQGALILPACISGTGEWNDSAHGQTGQENIAGACQSDLRMQKYPVMQLLEVIWLLYRQ